jgi:SAM-dependent methyltransferase
MSRDISGRQAVICPVCTATDCSEMRPYQARHDIFKGLHLLNCGECGMVFADPMPSVEEWAAYNRDFFAVSESSSTDNTEAVLFFKGIARLRLDHIANTIGGELPDSVLEIGPGPGYFCQAYKEKRPAVKYCAVETDLTCHGPLQELGVDVLTELTEVAARHCDFGLLVMSHVLEHSQDPRDFIRAALDLMQPGGLLFIEIPCLDFEYKPVFDAHVLFFDKDSLGRLLADAGIVEYQLSYHGATINTLRRELSRPGRLFNRGLAQITREPEIVESVRHLLDAATWNVVAPFMPHVENERPSRWLRALAIKPRT